MKNKTLGILLSISVGVSVFTALFEEVLYDSEIYYSIAGLGLIIFGIWGSIRLIKCPCDKKC